MIKILFPFLSFFILANAHAQVSFNIREIPYSTYGSYMAVMQKVLPNTTDSAVYIWDVSGRRMWNWKGVFKIEPTVDGAPIKVTKIESNPISVKIFSSKGIIEICYDDANTLRFKGNGVGIKLTQSVKDGSSVSFPIALDSSQWRVQMGGYDHYVMSALSGKLRGDAAFAISGHSVPKRPQFIADITPVNNVCEFAFEQYLSAWKARSFPLSFEDCKSLSKKKYDDFVSKLFPFPAKIDSTWNLAAYLKWSNVVLPKGIIKREAAYCSKNNMTSIWAWDNCFVAMSTCYKNLPFALDQIHVVFDAMNSKGIMPDYFNDNNTMWGMVKPPVQGYTLRKVEALSTQKISLKDRQLLYKKMSAYTNFWFTYMDDDHNGIPQYNHGNDSGEDNSTAFDMGYPVESPDLCTYMIIQLDYLAESAKLLGKNDEAKKWADKSDFMLKYLITELWDGNRFFVRHVFTKKTNPQSRAFINYTPLLLGSKLPKVIKDKMIQTLKSPDGPVTKFGPSSEAISSSLFEEDGYWRGAIWAPQFYFFIDGLRLCGEEAFAKKMAKTYIDLCKGSTFPENFSALTGKPLRDSGYSWTSDVYLLLCHEYFKDILTK